MCFEKGKKERKKSTRRCDGTSLPPREGTHNRDKEKTAKERHHTHTHLRTHRVTVEKSDIFRTAAFTDIGDRDRVGVMIIRTYG